MNNFEITALILFATIAVALFVFLLLFKFGKLKRFLKSDKKTEATLPVMVSQAELPKNEIAISAIESLIIKDNSGSELALTRPNAMQLAERKYREICVRGTTAIGQVAQGAMPVLAQAQTLNQIAKAAPNGLFTATAPIQDLMKYADGTVGSIVMEGKKIAEHAGFAEVALKTVNPAAVLGASMQTMAMISGQYYMDEISQQLKSIDRKLDKLIGYHHDEKIGILRNINRELSEIASKTNVDAADIIACQNMSKQCGEIYYEYYTRLEGVRIAAKERWLNKSKEIKELGTNIDESETNFSIQMCYQASTLREKSKLAEISVRLKIGGGQERFIAEQVEVLRKISDEAFHRDTRRYIDEHYAPVLEKAEKILESRKIPIPLLFGDVAKEASTIQFRKDTIIEKITEDENAENLAEKMLLFLTKPQETLVLLGETPDSQRVFVLDDAYEAEKFDG